MSEMVERVARAIYAVDGGKGWHLHAKFYMDAARAAIEAMREPTPEMVDALVHAEGECWADPNIPYSTIFTAAIDAALSE